MSYPSKDFIPILFLFVTINALLTTKKIYSLLAKCLEGGGQMLISSVSNTLTNNMVIHDLHYSLELFTFAVLFSFDGLVSLFFAKIIYEQILTYRKKWMSSVVMEVKYKSTTEQHQRDTMEMSNSLVHYQTQKVNIGVSSEDEQTYIF